MNKSRHTQVQIFSRSLVILVLPRGPQGNPGFSVSPSPLQVSLPFGLTRMQFSLGRPKMRMWGDHSWWGKELAAPSRQLRILLRGVVWIIYWERDRRMWFSRATCPGPPPGLRLRSPGIPQALGKSCSELVPKSTDAFRPLSISADLCLFSLPLVLSSFFLMDIRCRLCARSCFRCQEYSRGQENRAPYLPGLVFYEENMVCITV